MSRINRQLVIAVFGIVFIVGLAILSIPPGKEEEQTSSPDTWEDPPRARPLPMVNYVEESTADTDESPPSSEITRQTTIRDRALALRDAGVQDLVIRTPSNEATILNAVRADLLTEEASHILLGREHREAILARNLDEILSLAKGVSAERAIRAYAIAALGLYQGEMARHALLAMSALDDEQWVRNASLYALSPWIPQDQAVTDHVMGQTTSGSRSTRYVALSVLSRKQAFVEPNLLILCCSNADGLGASEAMDMLARESGLKALPILLDWAKTHPSRWEQEHAQGLAEHLQRNGRLLEYQDERSYSITFKSTTFNSVSGTNETVVQRYNLICWPPKAVN